jgi:hypothetical protein
MTSTQQYPSCLIAADSPCPHIIGENDYAILMNDGFSVSPARQV